MHAFDVLVQNYIVGLRSPWVTDFLYVLTSIFDASIHFILFSIFVAVLIYLVRNIYFALLFSGSLALGAVLVYFLKNIFDVARPLDGFTSVLGQSFPSGHATSATIFFVIIMYVFDSYFAGFKKVIFNTLAILGILTVAFSRVYLGVHWASDVVCGILLGVVVSIISIRLFKFVINRRGATSMIK